MSLAFLFKKTWHPSTLQNSERVWIAEQKDAAEKKRIEELTKQVREEQQVRELEEMQVGMSMSDLIATLSFGCASWGLPFIWLFVLALVGALVVARGGPLHRQLLCVAAVRDVLFVQYGSVGATSDQVVGVRFWQQ